MDHSFRKLQKIDVIVIMSLFQLIKLLRDKKFEEG